MSFCFSLSGSFKNGGASSPPAARHERSAVLHLGCFLSPLLFPPHLPFLLFPESSFFSFPRPCSPPLWPDFTASQLQTLLLCFGGGAFDSSLLFVSSVSASVFCVFECVGTTWRNRVQPAEPKLSPDHSDVCPAHLLRPERGREPCSLRGWRRVPEAITTRWVQMREDGRGYSTCGAFGDLSSPA